MTQKQTPSPKDPRITNARRQFNRALAALEEAYMCTGTTTRAMRRIARMLSRLAADYEECVQENAPDEREEIDTLNRWLGDEKAGEK